MSYVPDAGEFVWLDFDPQAGREQAGRRPALVLTPGAYNQKASLAIVCPVTTRAKGYPFEVSIPDDYPVKGVILADQARSLDWAARRAELIVKAPTEVISEVLGKLEALLVI